MNISRRSARTSFSGTGVAKLLGMNNKTVTAWCVAGELKATRRGSRRLPQQGGDVWEIQPHDLREFILDNLARIDIRKVEKVSFCELLTRCPHCEAVEAPITYTVTIDEHASPEARKAIEDARAASDLLRRQR